MHVHLSTFRRCGGFSVSSTKMCNVSVQLKIIEKKRKKRNNIWFKELHHLPSEISPASSLWLHVTRTVYLLGVCVEQRIRMTRFLLRKTDRWTERDRRGRLLCVFLFLLLCFLRGREGQRG